MSIIIQNITKGNPDLDHYLLRLNQYIIREFDHKFVDLARGLRAAADAVDISEKKRANAVEVKLNALWRQL